MPKANVLIKLRKKNKTKKTGSSQTKFKTLVLERLDELMTRFKLLLIDKIAFPLDSFFFQYSFFSKLFNQFNLLIVFRNAFCISEVLYLLAR